MIGPDSLFNKLRLAPLSQITEAEAAQMAATWPGLWHQKLAQAAQRRQASQNIEQLQLDRQFATWREEAVLRATLERKP